MAKLKNITQRLLSRSRVHRRELGDGSGAYSRHIRKQVASETKRLRNSLGGRKFNKVVAAQYKPGER